MTVVFGCPACGRGVEASPGETTTCPRCGADATLPAAGDTLERCLSCECDELYRHRDFNQKLGIVLILVGIVLCFVWGSFLPLLAAAAVDLALYLSLPDVVICYRCKAHHRGFANTKRMPKFDLERHEHYRFTKAREGGRLPKKPDG